MRKSILAIAAGMAIAFSSYCFAYDHPFELGITAADDLGYVYVATLEPDAKQAAIADNSIVFATFASEDDHYKRMYSLESYEVVSRFGSVFAPRLDQVPIKL